MKTMILVNAVAAITMLTSPTLSHAQGEPRQGRYECQLLLKDRSDAYSIEMDKKVLDVAPNASIELKGNKSEVYHVSIDESAKFISILNMDLGTKKISVQSVATTDASMVTAMNSFWSYATTCHKVR